MNSYPKPTRIFSLSNLREAWNDSPDSQGKGKAPGLDGQSAVSFGNDLSRNLEIVRSKVLQGGFEFSPLRPIPIRKKDKNKYRIICVPTVEDRVIQRVIRDYLINGDKLSVINGVSYGFIKGRGVPQAVRKAKNIRNEYPYAFKSDISEFFDTIDRDQLLDRIMRVLGKSSIVPLIHSAIQCEIGNVDTDTALKIETTTIKEGKGLRQGMPLSPLLSNFVLRRFDSVVERRKLRMVRYADDFVVLCKNRAEALDALDLAKEELDKVGLSIPDISDKSKTIIANPNQGIDFLGYELSKNKYSNRYDIRIPQYVFDQLKLDSQTFSDFVRARASYRTLARTLRKMAEKHDGVVNSYRIAKNISQLEQASKNYRNNAVRALIADVFGAEVLHQLNKEKLEFLSI